LNTINFNPRGASANHDLAIS